MIANLKPRPSILAASVALLAVCAGVASGHGELHERLEANGREIAAAPEDAQLRLQRANLLREHEDWSEALSECERAGALDRTLEVDRLRAQILVEARRPAEAVAVLDGILQRHPQDTGCQVWRARAYLLRGQPSAAAADFRAALESSAQPSPDLIQEAALAVAAADGEPAAVVVLDAGMAKLGPVPALVLRAIDGELASGNFDAALGRIAAMQASAPRPEPWMAKRAAVLAMAGKTVDSQAAWTALASHLNALPDAERGSHAMSQIREQAENALASLRNLPLSTPSTR
jgi:tetratricopeptide (TPR) repeat protein